MQPTIVETSDPKDRIMHEVFINLDKARLFYFLVYVTRRSEKTVISTTTTIKWLIID